jgi:hypothetical protein
MTGKILYRFIFGMVTLLFIQAPVFAHHRSGHKHGPPAHALSHYDYAKRHHKHGKGHHKHKKYDHDHGNHDDHAKHEGHDHHNGNGSSEATDPTTFKPEVCVKGVCLSSK